jgi:hypothetical protein
MPTAGYSGTPLPKKLGIKAGCALALIDAPTGFDETLGLTGPGAAQMPDDVTVSRSLGDRHDVVVAFFTDRRDLVGPARGVAPRAPEALSAPAVSCSGRRPCSSRRASR